MGIPNHSEVVKYNKFIRNNKKTGAYSKNRELLRKRFGLPLKYRYRTTVNAEIVMSNKRNIKNGFIVKKGRIVYL